MGAVDAYGGKSFGADFAENAYIGRGYQRVGHAGAVESRCHEPDAYAYVGGVVGAADEAEVQA